MKIIYISSSIIPSSYANSVHVMKMCSSLKRVCDDKLDITLLCMQGTIDNPLKFYDITEDISLIQIKVPNYRIFRPLIYNLRIFIYLLFNRGIIYSRYIYPLIFSILLRRKTYFEFHGLYTNLIEKNILKIYLKSKINIGTIYITKILLNLVNKEFDQVNNNKIVLPDCCDKKDILNNSIDNNKSIGYVGHLYKGRGMELMISIAKQIPDFKIHIIGGRTEDIEMYKKISPQNIIFHGFVKQSDLDDYYKLFNIALAPYQDIVSNAGGGNTVDYMSPMKIFEYMAYKKLIISSDLPAIREVASEKHIIFVENKDPNKWIEQILYFQNNPKHMIEIIDNATELFENNYTWDIRSKKLISFFKNN